ncbi:phage antirepressor [Halalkalibacterium halodurans]|uniref:Bro-N domain-containing protein n=1 Tax=Halalkalibacterium halodurans TaxID=86665 RepID=A0A0M0KNE5_ALKHA|nr:phage antirepressor [Halalkalibacterium halodurans]TPE70652.1 phage antirepressor [Halalkalibacterium halodurans]
MQQLQKVFSYQEAEVRTVLINDEIWFVAKDVCQVLGLSNPSKALMALKNNAKTTITLSYSGSNYKTQALVINEAGLYRLIFKSRKAEAVKFSDWVTEEVLPSIRKTGAYQVEAAPAPSYMIEDPIERAKQWIKEQEKVRLLEQRAAEYEEKANYVDQILLSRKTMTTTQIAKDYGMSAQRLNQILKEEGIQYKLRGQWLLKAAYHDKGYTKSRTVDIRRSDGRADIAINTEWTQEGRLFIHKVLTSRGYVALMDREEQHA